MLFHLFRKLFPGLSQWTCSSWSSGLRHHPLRGAFSIPALPPPLVPLCHMLLVCSLHGVPHPVFLKSPCLLSTCPVSSITELELHRGSDVVVLFTMASCRPRAEVLKVWSVDPPEGSCKINIPFLIILRLHLFFHHVDFCPDVQRQWWLMLLA